MIRRVGILGLLILTSLSEAAVQNGQLIVLWDVPADTTSVYELRWQHFAQPEWQPLPSVPSGAGSLTVTFSPLPATPATDRWVCVDARSVHGGSVGPWLSTLPHGAACNVVEVGSIVLPPPPPIVPPPVVPPPTPPSEPPPAELFGNLHNSKGVLSFDYAIRDCPRGVQQTTSAVRNGFKTITLTCRR